MASFFRFCPGLDKEVVGEYLGDAKEFKVKVLEAYARSFDFAGMTIDGSLRLFLEGFKLPGEAQKISRILENFAEVYYQCSLRNGGVVADADSVYVLSYSIIMLNTDLHNSQVRSGRAAGVPAVRLSPFHWHHTPGAHGGARRRLWVSGL